MALTNFLLKAIGSTEHKIDFHVTCGLGLGNLEEQRRESRTGKRGRGLGHRRKGVDS